MDKKKKALIAEICELMKKISPEGLSFLKEQASVLIYNQGVEASNETVMKEWNKKKKKAPERKRKASSSPEVYIEQLEKPGYFNIRIGKAKLFMDRHEIRALYKIANSAGSAAGGAAGLYNWFRKERSDVLSEGSIESPTSPVLKIIYRELMETFTTS